MEPKSKNLRVLIERLKSELKKAESELQGYESRCQHNWEKTIYDPIYHKAYTIPGDPPGTMGVDWRGPVYVPAETIDRWRRTCNTCGKIEYTIGVTETTTRKVPKWGKE
jgi:hypothetical protein